MKYLTKDKEAELRALLQPNKKITLRPEQEECITAIENSPIGSSVLAIMATGLGKTATFANLPRHGEKTLILSTGQEIVLNPLCYYDCPVGVEMGEFRAKRDFPNAEVISASVQSITRRLGDYDPKEFGTIIVDEAHHSAAQTYRTVLDYFKPKIRTVGFTATPNRTDGVRLSDIYSQIVFQRDIKWAIANDRLCNIFRREASLDVDLRNVRRTKGASGEMDFVQADLNRAMAKSAPSIVRIYHEYAFGPTVINVSSVPLAYEVASLIPGAAAVTGDMTMQDREAILSAFREGHIPCLCSVNVLREGVDIPNITTIIMARPTLSSTLYTQIVGRGLRLFPGKKALNLIDIKDCLGSNVSLCNAPTLLGIDMKSLPESARDSFNGVMLTDMERIAEELSDTPESWAFNAKVIQNWADSSGYDLHGVNWFKLPDGRMELTFPSGTGGQLYLTLPAPDALGMTTLNYGRMPLQVALDLTAECLERRYGRARAIWDRSIIERSWGPGAATPKQIAAIHAKLPEYDTSNITKGEASSVLNRIRCNGRHDKERDSQIQVLPPPPPEYAKKKHFVIDYQLPEGYLMDVSSKTLLADYCTWLERCILRAYQAEDQNLDSLIERINVSQKSTYVKNFLRFDTKYRYMCQMDEKSISRKDLSDWLSRNTDILIPRIIAARIVDPEKYKTPQKAKPKMTEPPFSSIVLTYPESSDIISGSRRKKLPDTAQQIQEKAMQRWADNEKRKARAKSSQKKPGCKRGRPRKEHAK